MKRTQERKSLPLPVVVDETYIRDEREFKRRRRRKKREREKERDRPTCA
jgi:hypothetical protein